MKSGAIGVFDSGFGGLNILKSFVNLLPQYNYIYLGDNARAPYGNRSFDTIYQYTLNSIKQLFMKGCNLIIIACNTSSAKALKTLQQEYLPTLNDPNKRILGIIIPTSEVIHKFTISNHIGILATKGTVNSQSYIIEIKKHSPQLQVFQQPCEMLVPLIENNEYNNEGANFFIKKYLNQLLTQSNKIDTILLGCTHYPILYQEINNNLSNNIKLISQSEIIAKSLENYLFRHPEIEKNCSKNSEILFYTSDSEINFNDQALKFFGNNVNSIKINW